MGDFPIKTRHKEDITEETHVSLCLLTRCIAGGTTMAKYRNPHIAVITLEQTIKQESHLQQHYSGQLQPNCKSEDGDVQIFTQW